jgi:HK97 family phage major capsid protein
MEDMNKIVEDVLTEVRSLKEELAIEKRALEAQRATFSPENPANANRETVPEWRDLASAIREKRSITLSGTGLTNVVSQIVKVASAKMPLLGKVRVFSGRDASTNIPVWSPSIAVPSAQAEGATGVANDSTAVLGVSSLTPYAYISVLPISNEALLLTGSNLEGELPNIFGEAFSSAMHAGILTGAGTGQAMTGVFTAGSIPASNLTACDEAGLPAMVDLVGLALKLQDFYDDGVIVMNPSVYSHIMADTTEGYDVYKEELARGKTIEGVKVILTSYAPNTVTAGSVIVAGGRFSDYALGVASSISIEPMKKVGDNITYFQAVGYWNGKPILGKNFFGLKTV